MGVAEPFRTDFEQLGCDQTCLDLVGVRTVDEEVEAVPRDNSEHFCSRRESRHGELSRGEHGIKYRFLFLFLR